MKVCSVQPVMSATIAENVATITRWMERASEHNAELMVFPEMMLIGYDFHLHSFFREPNWYQGVENAISEINDAACKVNVRTLIGTPYSSGKGYLNALLLLQPGKAPVLGGARTFLVDGWKKVWAFVEAQDRSPIRIGPFRFGSVFCAESSFLDRVKGRGLEDSDVILWPSVSTSTIDSERRITEDGCGDGAQTISQTFGIPVIQSNYVAQISAMAEDRILGSSIICDASGRILVRASYTEEELLFCDIDKINDEIVITPLSG